MSLSERGAWLENGNEFSTAAQRAGGRVRHDSESPQQAEDTKNPIGQLWA
jgi:hypothetical protein